jgi:hypothetical protein
MSIRWERLFGDLEGQLEAAERADLAAEVADRTRYEISRTTLADRLRAALGSDLDLTVAGVGAVSGSLTRVGADFLVIEVAGSFALIRAAAVVAVRNLRAASQSPAETVAARISLGMVARELARDRAAVTVWLRDGATLVGTIDRVGADYLDLAEHSLDEPRRVGTIHGLRTVAVEALAMVRAGS